MTSNIVVLAAACLAIGFAVGVGIFHSARTPPSEENLDAALQNLVERVNLLEERVTRLEEEDRGNAAGRAKDDPAGYTPIGGDKASRGPSDDFQGPLGAPESDG